MQTQPMEPIARDQFKTYEALILSGQIAERDVSALLDANPDFSEWYRGRSALRHHLSRKSVTAGSRSDTSEDRMNSALWGCFGFAGIVVIVIGAGGFFIVRSLL